MTVHADGQVIDVTRPTASQAYAVDLVTPPLSPHLHRDNRGRPPPLDVPLIPSPITTTSAGILRSEVAPVIASPFAATVRGAVADQAAAATVSAMSPASISPSRISALTASLTSTAGGRTREDGIRPIWTSASLVAATSLEMRVGR